MDFRLLPSAPGGALLVLMVLACAPGRPEPAQLPTREYTGHYTMGDGSWFRPCGAGADETWWVTFLDRAVAQRDSGIAAGRLVAGAPSFVRWRAAYDTSGRVGPRGPGSPALYVREISEMRPAAPEDCPR